MAAVLRNPFKRVSNKGGVLGLLVVSSVIGVLLVIVAVYNASRELEVVDNIAELHRIAASQAKTGAPQANPDVPPPLTSVVIAAQDAIRIDGRAITRTELEASRINTKGGLLETPDGALVWTLVPASDTGAQIFLAQPHHPLGFASLSALYAKRLLIPAAFYVWLMVWIGLIIRHFNARLASQKEALEYMALHDTLSGLPNRNLLENRLQQLIKICERDAKSFAFALVDLNGFKAINDRLGHVAGDELLRQIGERLRDTVRATDTAARIGGDEFVLLLDEVDDVRCARLCNRLHERITQPLNVHGHNVCIGASIGVAQYPGDGREAEILRRKADKAMYQAKAAGGGVCFYDSVAPTPRHKASGI